VTAMRAPIIIVLLLLGPPSIALAQEEPQGEEANAPTRELSPSRVREMVREALTEALPDGMELLDVHWSRRVRLPRGRVAVRAHIQGDEPVNGRLRAGVELLVNGVPARSLRVRVAVRDGRPVVVARRQLRPGQLVRSTDVELHEAPAGPGPRQPLRDLDEVVGREVMRLIQVGDTLEQPSVRRPPAVSRGERVRVVSHVGGIRISTQGEPMEDGALGETIRVVCSASRRTIRGRVAGPGVVEVGP